jgi:hypothetical protein
MSSTQVTYKQTALPSEARFSRTVRLRNGDLFWYEESLFNELNATLQQKLKLLWSDDPGTQLNALGWLDIQAKNGIIYFAESHLDRFLEILQSPPDADCRETVLRLVYRLVKYPSEMGTLLLRHGILEIIESLGRLPPVEFLADLMRASSDCQAFLLQDGVSRRLWHCSIVDFAVLSSAIAFKRPIDDDSRDYFLANLNNIPAADDDDLPILVASLCTFVVADPAFVALFCDKNPLKQLFARISNSKAEGEAVALFTVIANHSLETAKFLAEEGVLWWVMQRLTLENRTRTNVKDLIVLAADILFQGAHCQGDLFEMSSIIVHFFEESRMNIKEAVLKWLMVVALRAPEWDFQRVVHQFQTLLSCPAQIPRADLAIYFEAIQRILTTTPEATKLAMINAVVTEGELPEFLEGIALDKNDPELAARAAYIREMLVVEFPESSEI